ncbi:MAG: STAS/SEC14 domain-containing protein [Pirellulales bacterium]|nr:STAS/SEC14 domain-containing protein [Pirellulales bacterium]
MTDSIAVASGGKVLEVSVTGKLTKEFYTSFVPTVDQQIAEHGKIRVLFVMHDFHGWTAGALWEDSKFDFRHWRDIQRLAIVGETQWQHGMAVFCKPFTMAKIRYFDHTQIDDARTWLEAD